MAEKPNGFKSPLPPQISVGEAFNRGDQLREKLEAEGNPEAAAEGVRATLKALGGASAAMPKIAQAFSENGFVPVSKELIWEAIQEWPRCIASVKPEWLTPEDWESLQLMAVEKHPDVLTILVRNGVHVSAEVRMAALKKDGRLIKHLTGINGASATEEEIITACGQNGFAVVDLKNQGIKLPSSAALAAIRNNHIILKYLLSADEFSRLKTEFGYPETEKELAALHESGKTIDEVGQEFVDYVLSVSAVA